MIGHLFGRRYHGIWIEGPGDFHVDLTDAAERAPFDPGNQITWNQQFDVFKLDMGQLAGAWIVVALAKQQIRIGQEIIGKNRAGNGDETGERQQNQHAH